MPALLDLTVTTSGFLNGGFFELIDQQPAGSGVIDSFVRLHDLGPGDTNTPEGHNTSGRNQGSPKLNFDENSSPVFTHDLQLQDIPKVKVGPTWYREFRLDVNEPNNSTVPRVSLNKVKIFSNSVGGLLASPTNLATLGTLRWDMDGNVVGSDGPTSGPDTLDTAPPSVGNWVKLFDKNHGSGQADMRLLVPESAFNGVANTDYIYFYSRFGDTKAMTGGYEEWYLGPAPKEKPVTVVTQIHQTSPIDQLGPLDGSVFTVAFGSTVHDHAYVTDHKGNAVTTGSVIFSFWLNGNCMDDPDMTWEDTNGADGWSTPDVGPLFPSMSQDNGNFSFAARYVPSAGFSPGISECEPLHVNRGQPGVDFAVTTEVHNEAHQDVTNQAIPLGSVVHDEATVTPTLLSYPTPTGTVTFTFYRNGNCEGTGEPAGTVTLTLEAANRAIAHPSDAFGPLGAGSYSFRARYNGDTNYDPGDGPCEPFTVNKGDVRIRTEVHDNDHDDITGAIIVQGTQVHDAAFADGVVVGIPISGTVTYRLYQDNNGDGDGADPGDALFSTEVKNIVGGVIPESSVITPAGGFWAYQVTYSGDNNYNGPVVSAWEPFTVLTEQDGRTPGFWQNQVGEAQLLDGGTMEPELKLLRDANLKLGGIDFDPTTYTQLQDFLLGTNATNMSDMLSRHLAATILNVEAGFVAGGALAFVAPFGLTGNAGPGNQFMSVNDLIAAANAELALHPSAFSDDPWRSYQEALKNALAAINEDKPIFLP